MQFTGLAYGFNYSKQHNNAFNLHKITKIRVKSQKYGRFCQNARIYGHARINTGDFFTLELGGGAPPIVGGGVIRVMPELKSFFRCDCFLNITVIIRQQPSSQAFTIVVTITIIIIINFHHNHHELTSSRSPSSSSSLPSSSYSP